MHEVLEESLRLLQPQLEKEKQERENKLKYESLTEEEIKIANDKMREELRKVFVRLGIGVNKYEIEIDWEEHDKEIQLMIEKDLKEREKIFNEKMEILKQKNKSKKYKKKYFYECGGNFHE